MTEADLRSLLDRITIADEVFDLRPDYRVLLIAVAGLEGGPTDVDAEAALRSAEAAARTALAEGPPEDLPHVTAWREAYRSFGAKPQRTRNSLEALLRRAESGLPRVDRLTDLYNALSVLHELPIGGEDLTRYEGAPRLVRAQGDEGFDTVANGAPATEHPNAGELVWRDDIGVTCRRWNWRQASRTRLEMDTTAALFVFDALAPLTDGRLEAAGDDLLIRLGPGVRSSSRIISRPSTSAGAGGS